MQHITNATAGLFVIIIIFWLTSSLYRVHDNITCQNCPIKIDMQSKSKKKVKR